MYPLKYFIYITLFIILSSSWVTAQLSLCDNPNIHLLKDINLSPDVHELNTTSILYNHDLYYTFDDGIHGLELWTSDNTVSGTRMVEDIYPGPFSSGIEELVLIGDILYFKADKGENGCELYSMDLTSSTPKATIVKDIVPGNGSSCPSHLTVVAGKLFFMAYTSATGRELWISDGTMGGTALVKDLDGLPTSTKVDYFYSALDKLFFTADLQDTGEELWVSDGSPSGTHLLKDIYPGPRSFTRLADLQLVEFDDAVYFRAQSSSNNTALWRSDGTSAGTVSLTHSADANNNFNPFNLVVVNNQIYMNGAKAIINDQELFKSDGDQVELVKDINLGTSASSPRELVAFDGTLIFRADDGINGSELWKSDGTSIGTKMIMDINPSGDSQIDYMTYVDGLVYFFTEDDSSLIQLWSSAGTAASTQMLYTLPAGAEVLKVFRMAVEFFFVVEDDELGIELWYSDGGESTTGPLADIAPGALNAMPQHFTVDQDFGHVFFFAHSPTSGMQLYNATESGPIRFLGEKGDLEKHSAGVEVDLMTHWGDKVVLRVEDLGSEDLTYWITDGSTASTIEASLGLDIGFRYSFADAGSHFMIIYEDHNDDFNLVQSDGTLAGTSTLTNFGAINYSYLLASVDGLVLFYKVANDNSTSLWSVMPNQQPVLLASDMGDIWSSDEEESGLFLDGSFYFFSETSNNELTLWKTDGTSTGTVQLHSFDDASVASAQVIAEKLVMLISPSSSSSPQAKSTSQKSAMNMGPQVWVTDGSIGGTSLVTEIDPTGSINVIGSSPLYDKMVFTTQLFEVGQGIASFKSQSSSLVGIWSTDGTVQGTSQLIELDDVSILNTVSDKVYLVSSLDHKTSKLYSTDGSIAGTTAYDIDLGIPFGLHHKDVNEEYLFSMGGQAIFSNIIGCQGIETYLLDKVSGTMKILYDVANYSFKPSLEKSPIPLGDKTIMLLDNGVTGPELYAIDCACEDSLRISDDYMDSGLYRAGQVISILAKSRPNADIELRANNSVEFEGGFTIGTSSQLNVAMDICNE